MTLLEAVEKARAERRTLSGGRDWGWAWRRPTASRKPSSPGPSRATSWAWSPRPSSGRWGSPNPSSAGCTRGCSWSGWSWRPLSSPASEPEVAVVLKEDLPPGASVGEAYRAVGVLPCRGRPGLGVGGLPLHPPRGGGGQHLRGRLPPGKEALLPASPRKPPGLPERGEGGRGPRGGPGGPGEEAPLACGEGRGASGGPGGLPGLPGPGGAPRAGRPGGLGRGDVLLARVV